VLPRDEITLDGSMRVTFSQEENCEQSPSIVTATSLATLVEHERTTRASENVINPSLHGSAPASTDGSNIRLVLLPRLQCLCWFTQFVHYC
jgi:hypothetical protein